VSLTRLLLRHTDGATTTARRLGMLASHTQAPEVTETAVGSDLLQTFEVLTDLAVEDVGHDLAELSVLDVLLSVEEIVGNLVLARVRHDRYHLLHLLLTQFTGPLAKIDVSLATNDVSVTTTDTLDGRQSECDLSATIDVRVHNTKNVLKFLGNHQRHLQSVLYR
jgi:hypothetical protein